MKMQNVRKEFLFFEWVVIDNCNLNCGYCVNKGEYSQKPQHAMRYVPGKEIEIAEKIREYHEFSRKTVVNLTGGEPLLAHHIQEVVSLLSTLPTFELHMVSNFALADKIVDQMQAFRSILISLHIQHRSEKGIEHLITMIERAKSQTQIRLSQVDYQLAQSNKEKLSEISKRTELPIDYQPFIPPWTTEGAVENSREILDDTFVSSFGKRCSLGHLCYFLLPDGSFYHGLWCKELTRKTGNFLRPLSENREAFFSGEMATCPASSCGCNYNTFYYDDYLAECQKLGYSQQEIFERLNIKPERVGLGEKIHRKLSDVLKSLKR